MFNTIFGDNFYLNTQYFRATGERYLLENPERQARFVSFYEERRQLGRNLFRQLRRQNHNLTNDRTLELFAGEIDSIGVLFNTHVVDTNIRQMRESHHCNLIRSAVPRDMANNFIDNSSTNRLHINLDLFNRLDINVRFGDRLVIDFDLSNYYNFVLLNPRNLSEEMLMRRLIRSNQDAYVGYFGSNNDLDREEHEESIRRLQERTGAELITDLSLNNGYAYILTNRTR